MPAPQISDPAYPADGPKQKVAPASLGWWLALPRWGLRWVRLTPARRTLAVEALFALIQARVWLMWRSFSAVAERLGTPVPADQITGPLQTALDDHQTLQAREVAMMVRWIARYVPFRAVCLQQAIAARAMLTRRGIPSVMHFGVRREVQHGRINILAHAWLDVGTIEITGFDLAGEYQEIARFI